MKNILSFLLLALVATTGWAQKKVWNDIVTGYASAPIIKVTKVAFYDDRTEVFLRLEVPQRMVGQSVPIAAKPILKADGKEYAVKEATVIKLNEPYAIPADGKVDFSVLKQKFLLSGDGKLILYAYNCLQNSDSEFCIVTEETRGLPLETFVELRVPIRAAISSIFLRTCGFLRASSS